MMSWVHGYWKLESRAPVNGSAVFVFMPRRTVRLRYFGVPAGAWRIWVTGSLIVEDAGEVPLDVFARRLTPEEVDEPIALSSDPVSADALLDLMRGFPAGEETPGFYFLHEQLSIGEEDYLVLRVEDLHGKGMAPEAIIANGLTPREKPQGMSRSRARR